MLPKDDQGGITGWVLAGVGILWTLLAAAWTWIWASIPDKRYVDNRVGESEDRIMVAFDDWKEKDLAHDRELFKDMIGPVVGRIDNLQQSQERAERLRESQHKENQRMLREILETLRPKRAL